MGLYDDNRERNLMKQIVLNTLEELISNKETVLVHCAAGMSRSAWVIAKYLSNKEKKSLDEIYIELKKIMPTIWEDSPLRGPEY